MLKRFTAGCKPTHWIRGEWLFYDFVRAVGSILYPLTDQQMRTIAQVQAKSPRQYNHDVHTFWSPQQIRELYELNPRWSKIERLIYAK